MGRMSVLAQTEVSHRVVSIAVAIHPHDDLSKAIDVTPILLAEVETSFHRHVVIVCGHGGECRFAGLLVLVIKEGIVRVKVDVLFKDYPDEELSDIERCLNVECLNVFKAFMPSQAVSIVNENFHTSFVVVKESCRTLIGAEARYSVKQIAIRDFFATDGAFSCCTHNCIFIGS